MPTKEEILDKIAKECSYKNIEHLIDKNGSVSFWVKKAMEEYKDQELRELKYKADKLLEALKDASIAIDGLDDLYVHSNKFDLSMKLLFSKGEAAKEAITNYK